MPKLQLLEAITPGQASHLPWDMGAQVHNVYW